MNSLDINEIFEHLPHRYPFLLVDRVLDYQAGERIHAVKNVTINEPFFNGHFPRHPVMPGVLIIEALAQAAGILSVKTMGTARDEDSVFYFVGIDGARFKKPVFPGDVLNLHVELVRQMRGEAKVDGQVVAEAEFMASIVDRDGGTARPPQP